MAVASSIFVQRPLTQLEVPMNFDAISKNVKILQFGPVEPTHRKFWLRNGRGKTCLWKKYMLVYFDSQKPGKKKVSLPTLSF